MRSEGMFRLRARVWRRSRALPMQLARARLGAELGHALEPDAAGAAAVSMITGTPGASPSCALSGGP